MKIKIAFCAIFIILLTGFVHAAENMTENQKAVDCINDSSKIMSEMIESGFNVQRVNDSLNRAENFYSAQLVLEKNKKMTDFSAVLQYCDDISKTREEAFLARDEVYSLNQFYNEANKSGVNMGEADLLIKDINQEMSDERYEKAREKIPIATDKISEIRASSTTLNLFYKSTTRTIWTFLTDNWITIVILLIVVVAFLILYNKKISRYLIQRKINHLETEKKVLKGLIENTQRDYFQHGRISESTFNVRTKRFSELVRDIDRQIPLLEEQLVKNIGGREWIKRNLK